jgi:hypothetical protein
MDKVALWLGYAVLLAGGVGLCAVCLWLAAEGVWRAWRAWRGFFNIVAAFDALREKQQAAHGVLGTFWLIERGANQGQSPTMWWSSKPDAVSTYSWVEFVHEATHFDSAAAAEAMAQAQYITHYAVTSHNYVDGGQR